MSMFSFYDIVIIFAAWSVHEDFWSVRFWSYRVWINDWLLIIKHLWKMLIACTPWSFKICPGLESFGWLFVNNRLNLGLGPNQVYDFGWALWGCVILFVHTDIFNNFFNLFFLLIFMYLGLFYWQIYEDYLSGAVLRLCLDAFWGRHLQRVRVYFFWLFCIVICCVLADS